jgi:rod shape-determining protein MreB
LGSLRGGRGGDIAVDLGTANTVVYVRGEGVVLFEPSVIAIDHGSGSVVAVGEDARQMIGRTPATISAIRPLRSGVIADFEITEHMLRHFLRNAIRRLGRPRLVLCVPSGLTGVERDAMEEAARAAGAREVYPIEEPLAAAVGAELPVAEPTASMIVDIGGGTSEVAVISLGSMVVWRSLRSGGFELDDAIVAHVKREHGLEIGEQQAEHVKLQIGSAIRGGGSGDGVDVGGRDLLTGQLRRTTVTSGDVWQAIESTVTHVVETVTETLEQTPAELSADIAERGIVLAGGGSLLDGLPDRLRADTGLAVHLVDDPLTCVARGAGRCLEELDVLARSAKATGSRGHAALR